MDGDCYPAQIIQTTQCELNNICMKGNLLSKKTVVTYHFVWSVQHSDTFDTAIIETVFLLLFPKEIDILIKNCIPNV